MNSYQAVTRTIIMLGTIAVGSMAWRVYGPPAEKLAPIIHRSVEAASELLGRKQPDQAAAHAAAPLLSKAEESTPGIARPESAPLRVDSDVEPAGHSEPIADSPLPSRSLVDPAISPIDDLLAQLKRLGAVETSLQPWGNTGKFYRFQCRLATAENPTLERHFDAIEADPRAAVARVLESVRRQVER